MADDVPSFLHAQGLGAYAETLVDLGYDSVEFLRKLEPGELAELVAAAKMKPGHAAKLRKALAIAAASDDGAAAAAAAAAAPHDDGSSDGAAGAAPAPPPAPPPPPQAEPSQAESADLQADFARHLYATNSFGKYAQGNIHTVTANTNQENAFVSQKPPSLPCATSLGSASTR